MKQILFTLAVLCIAFTQALTYDDLGYLQNLIYRGAEGGGYNLLQDTFRSCTRKCTEITCVNGCKQDVFDAGLVTKGG